MYGYIYKTTNLINGKIYVGQKKSTKFLGNKYLGSGKALKKAIIKYGIATFTVELLEICETKEQLNKQERYWIKILKAQDKEIGYNIADGGIGVAGDGFKAHKHSEETKQKISKSISNYNREHRVGVSMKELCGDSYVNGMKGKPAKNKGLIKIYNESLNTVKYIKNIEELINYPGYTVGGPKAVNADYSYLEKPEYIQQLKNRFKDTHFIHNDALKLCKRIKDTDIYSYLVDGWELGRKYYNK